MSLFLPEGAPAWIDSTGGGAVSSFSATDAASSFFTSSSPSVVLSLSHILVGGRLILDAPGVDLWEAARAHIKGRVDVLLVVKVRAGGGAVALAGTPTLAATERQE